MSVLHQIARAKRASRAEASDAYSFVVSRGAYLRTYDAEGWDCEPWRKPEVCRWDGEHSTLAALIASAAQCESVERVYVEGGYDGADTMHECDRKPFVSAWQVLVWDREGGAR